jgi:hypothetical protein
VGNLEQEYTIEMVKLALDRCIHFATTDGMSALRESETLLDNPPKGV